MPFKDTEKMKAYNDRIIKINLNSYGFDDDTLKILKEQIDSDITKAVNYQNHKGLKPEIGTKGTEYEHLNLTKSEMIARLENRYILIYKFQKIKKRKGKVKK